MEPFNRCFKQQTDKELMEKAVLSVLTDSNYAKQLLLERDAERPKAQTLERQKLEPLRSERDQELPALKAKRAQAEMKVTECRAALDEAEKERSAAAAEESTRTWWFQAHEEKVIAHIKSLAPPCIDDFMFELAQLEIETRNSVRTEVRETAKNLWNGGFSHRFESNIAAVEKRVAAIRAARTTAEQLKLEAIPETEIVARLEKLNADLPGIDDYTVTTVPVPDATELRRAHL